MTTPDYPSQELLSSLTQRERDELLISLFIERNLAITKHQLLVQGLILHCHKEVEEAMDYFVASVLSVGLEMGAFARLYEEVCELDYARKQQFIKGMFSAIKWQRHHKFMKELNEIRNSIAHVTRDLKKHKKPRLSFNNRDIYSFYCIS